MELIFEARKRLKLLEEKIEELNMLRRTSSDFKYTKSEKDSNSIVKPTRTVADIIKEIDSVNCTIIDLKSAIRKANETVIYATYTISDAIFMLKMIQSEWYSIQFMLNKQPISRQVSNQEIEYCELNYDVEVMKKYADDLKKNISDLQLKIDQANLTVYI